MKKKVLFSLSIGLFLVIVLSFVSLAEEVVTIRFWSEWSAEPQSSAIESVLKDFHESHPNIRIEHRAIENEEFHTTMKTAFSGSNPPDVFQHEGLSNVFQYVKADKVYDLTEWYGQNQANFIDGSEKAIKYNEKYWGVPWEIQNLTQLYYNKKILKKYNIEPPKTWAEFMQACETLKENNVIPIAMGNRDGWPGGHWVTNILLRYVGAERLVNVVTRQNNVKWTDPDFVEGVKIFTELSDKDYFSKGKASDNFNTAKMLFFMGRAGFFQTGAWFIADLVDAPADFEVGITRFPVMKNGKGEPNETVMQTLNGISISKATKHSEAALEFINFLIKEEVAQKFFDIARGMSAVKAVELKDPMLQKIQNEFIKPATKVAPFLEQALPFELGQGPFKMMTPGLLTNDVTVEEYLETLEELGSSLEPNITSY